MSFNATRAVVEQSQTRGIDRLILLVLAFRADDEGRCWPGLSRIAEDAGVDRRTVCRRLAAIEKTGELAIERQTNAVQTRGGKQAVNVYRLTLCRPQGRGTPPPPRPDKVGADSHKGRGTPPLKVGAGSASKVGAHSHPNGNSENGNLNRQGNGKATAALPGRIDYEKTPIPEVTDHGDIHNPEVDPVLVAMAITGEQAKSGWGRWAKHLRHARKTMDPAMADRLFRATLAELYGEMKAGEVDKPGAVLNIKLDATFGKLP